MVSASLRWRVLRDLDVWLTVLLSLCWLLIVLWTRPLVDRHACREHRDRELANNDRGRLLAMLLSIYGLAMFGYITATFASFFVGRDAQEAAGPVAGSKDIRILLKEVQSLRAEIAARAAPERAAAASD